MVWPQSAKQNQITPTADIVAMLADYTLRGEYCSLKTLRANGLVPAGSPRGDPTTDEPGDQTPRAERAAIGGPGRAEDTDQERAPAAICYAGVSGECGACGVRAFGAGGF